MRTVTFVSIYNAVLRRLGIDPVSDAATQDTARAITEHATERTKRAWEIWPWAELTLTEERAYRQVWNATVQYLAGEELYYKPDTKYYRVKIDAPVGMVPTNATYFELLDPVTQFVARDQRNKRPMGLPIGVYASNPSLNGCCPPDICLNFRPSQNGIRVYCGAATVFIQYLLPPPEFTVVPWITGKPYGLGERVFYHVTGESYRSLAANNAQIPTDPATWVMEGVPARFATYLKAAVFADTLREIQKPKDPGEAQTRLGHIQLAESEAKDALESEIDKEYRQGYKSYYVKGNWPCVSWHYDGTLWWPHTGICCSAPWTGSEVHELTDAIEYLPAPIAPPPLPMGPTFLYEIVAIRTIDGAPSLQQVTTTNRLVNSLVVLVIVVGGIREEQTWQLRGGPANPADLGELQPDDYNALSNDKHWVRVG